LGLIRNELTSVIIFGFIEYYYDCKPSMKIMLLGLEFDTRNYDRSLYQEDYRFLKYWRIP